MNRNKIWLYAGLGVLATCISILAAKKYKKKGQKGSELPGYDPEGRPRYKERVQ